MNLYIYQNNQQLGPFTLEEIQQKLQSGAVTQNDMAWYEGAAQWVPISAIQGVANPIASSMVPPTPANVSSTFTNPANGTYTHTDTGGPGKTKTTDEKFCVDCGAIINNKAEICPKCGVRQKSAGFLKKFKDRISNAKKALIEEEKCVTGISPLRKVIAIIVAISAGWTGITGLGSMIAGRPKSGAAMLGLPFMLIILTIGCIFGLAISAIASIFVVGIPFFLFFLAVLGPLIPITATTYVFFLVADITVCIRAK